MKTLSQFDIDPWTIITVDGKVPSSPNGAIHWVNGQEAAEVEAKQWGALPVSIALLEAFYAVWLETGDYQLTAEEPSETKHKEEK